MTPRQPAVGGPLLPQPGISPYQHQLTAATRAWPFSSGNPLWPALLLALVTHALLIYALDFKPSRPLPSPLPTLDVLVLRQADEATLAPMRPDALANHAQEAERDGNGDNNDTPSRASEPHAAPVQELTRAASADLAPIPADPSDAMTDGTYVAPVPETSNAPAPETTAPPAAEVPEEATATLVPNPPLPPDHLPPDPLQPETLSADTNTAASTDTAPAPTADPRAAPASSAGPVPRLSAASILASRGEEIARLNAKLAEDTAAFTSRPRRKAISASTQEYKYASYLEAWRRKVEAIGNLNYPEEARRRKLYGNLILQVGVRADGSLEEVRVLRSSGSTLLDEAAVRIVHLAAPFAPFPPDIRRETDFLDITRTWQFLSNNRFGGKP